MGRVDAGVRNQFLGSAPGTAEIDHVMVVLRDVLQYLLSPDSAEPMSARELVSG